MRKWLFLLIALLVLAVPIAASATTVNRSPDATFPHSSELNKPEYWGENCVKYERGFDGSVGHLPSGYSLLVLKAGQNNFVWYNPPAGDYGTPDFKDISHSIVCRGEYYEPCSDTTGWIFSERVFVREKPNGDKVYSDVYLQYDAQDESLVCNRRAQIVIEPYRVCSQQTGWVFHHETEEQKPNGTIVKKYVYFKYDLIDGETICDTMVAVERIPYTACEGETIYGPWSDWVVSGEEQTRVREVLDAITEEVCGYETEKTCAIIDKVFYWDDGWCKMRQREGPIGGQTRPFIPMIYRYCGCGYEWGEWTGYWVNNCQSQYDFWNELPEFCGAQSCE